MSDAETVPEAHVISRAEELLHKEFYLLREAAEVLGVPPRLLESAIYGGELKAEKANHDIIGVHRHDLIQWLRSRNFER